VRRELRPGEAVFESGDDTDRFYVVISGMLQTSFGAVLRPGDTAGGLDPPPAGMHAVLPSTVASCDRAAFEELIRPALPS
jgi:CRP-like cAMP-binding protein